MILNLNFDSKTINKLYSEKKIEDENNLFSVNIKILF